MKLMKSEKWALIKTALFLALILGVGVGSCIRDADVVLTEFSVRSNAEIYEQNAAVSQTENTSARININTCTKEELESLPGIGPVLAERIIEYRKQNGSFKTIEDITKVRGIGAAIYEDIYRLICTQ